MIRSLLKPSTICVCLLIHAIPLAGQTTQPALPREQSSPPKQVSEPTGDKSLTDDLLDLLGEPPKSPMPSTDKKSADVHFDGEDLGQQPSNPLDQLRQDMLHAAGLLEKGQTSASTQKLQKGIVARLDELIDQLDRSSQTQQQSTTSQLQSEPPDEQQKRATKDRQQQSASQALQARKKANDDKSENDPLPPDAARGSESGELKTAGTTSKGVQLTDPRAMQQQVWGQLPERVRQQMQSRMVEQFLPSYREQIEAYYRELAK